MNDDSMRALWTSDDMRPKEDITAIVETVLSEDLAARNKVRRLHLGSLAVLAILCPVLLWAAANGVTPLVRVGYALAAVGAAMMVSAEWTHARWSRQALPGPADWRSQLQRSAYLLFRQAELLRMAPLWTAPVYVGMILIGIWTQRERSVAAGVLLQTLVCVAWVMTGVSGVRKARRLDARAGQMTDVLKELSQ